MKIIYVHHAERNLSYSKDLNLRNKDDITLDGIKEAMLLAKKLKKINVTSIITSPYLRCRHTAEILNEGLNVNIIDDDRFNEFKMGETVGEFLKRNMEAINDIVTNYNDSDTIICVTSGVNITAFICYFYGIDVNDSTKLSQAASISPIIFEYKK